MQQTIKYLIPDLVDAIRERGIKTVAKNTGTFLIGLTAFYMMLALAGME